jgi:agmatinase
MTQPPSGATFLGAPLNLDPGAAQPGFAFLGAPFVTPYEEVPPGLKTAPAGAEGRSVTAADAVREASAIFANDLDHYDFDIGAALVQPGSPLPLTDCGDVPMGAGSVEDAARITEEVRALSSAGAVPLVVGGDHAVPPPVVRGLDASRALHVLHIDAHLDFRDEVGGVRDGYSSPIRRLRDLPFVETVVQVGLRDVGSARPPEVAAAAAAGNILVRAEEVHEAGVDRIPPLFPEHGRLYITVDADGLDPSCAPGVGWPSPGGLLFWQTARLIRLAVRRCRLAGMDVCEFVPARDREGLTALVVARLLMIAMGAALRP